MTRFADAQGNAAESNWRIGIDVGGTFTDLVAIGRSGVAHVFKTSSTPHDPAQGVLAALDEAGAALAGSRRALLERCRHLIHGTTVATNILLEGKGARVGLLATRGFRDTLAIRRGLRVDPWNHRAPNPPVLVPRHLRLGIGGRIDADGSESEPLDEGAVIEAARYFQDQDVEAVAICLFNSFLNADHERRAAELLARHWRGAWLSTSSQVAPLMGEYERTSTTVVNAYIGPRTVTYLKRLDAILSKDGLRRPMLLMQSNGGAVSVHQIAVAPYTLLLSGPAAAVGALRYLSRATGIDDLISMEIGGTSCDVLLMQQTEAAIADQVEVAGYHLSMPSVDIHTIGAGGGTIAGIDGGGMLYAGPAGAGASPGPAAYGRGGIEATVTDAHLVLGRLKPGAYAGGAVTLDLSRANAAIEGRIANPLGLDREAAAAGILRLVDQSLLHAVQRISIERGYDPRRFTLVAGGGAGPMHGAAVGRMLGCRVVLIPRISGALCAFGMLNTDVRHDFVRSYLAPLETLDNLGATFTELEQQGRALLADEGFCAHECSLRRELSLRYIGQQWDIPVEVSGVDPGIETEAVRGSFEAAHQRLFGHIQPGGSIEITRLWVIATGLLPAAAPHRPPAATRMPEPVEVRPCYVQSAGWRDVPVYDGCDLAPGHRLDGPLIVNEQTATVVIGAHDRLEVEPNGNFIIRLPEPAHA